MTPILCLHGLGGSANGFARTLRELKARFADVTALDLPGSGFSALPTAGPLTLDAQVELVSRFIQQVVGAPCLVVGNSLGGAMALTLASRFPQAVRALSAVAPAGARVSEERFRSLMASFDIQNAAQARSTIRKLFHAPPLSAVLFARTFAEPFQAPAARAIRAASKPTDCLEPSLLQSIRVPLLLLWGASEKLLPYEGVDYFRAHLPPHARVEVVEGFGHVPQVERPRELADRLFAFAKEVGL